MSFFRFALLVVGALVLFGATMGLYWEQFYANLRSDGAMTTATITRVDAQDGSRPASVYFTFQTKDGRSVDGMRWISMKSVPFLRPGAKLNVRYLPSTPSVHEVVVAENERQDAGRWAQYLILTVFSMALMFWVSDTPRLRKQRLRLSANDIEAGDVSADGVAVMPTTGGAIVKRFR